MTVQLTTSELRKILEERFGAGEYTLHYYEPEKIYLKRTNANPSKYMDAHSLEHDHPRLNYLLHI